MPDSFILSAIKSPNNPVSCFLHILNARHQAFNKTIQVIYSCIACIDGAPHAYIKRYMAANGISTALAVAAISREIFFGKTGIAVFKKSYPIFF
jgi:hypothetical protein